MKTEQITLAKRQLTSQKLAGVVKMLPSGRLEERGKIFNMFGVEKGGIDHFQNLYYQNIYCY